MDDLIAKIKKVSQRKNSAEQIEALIEYKLNNDPQNTELWLRLAILEVDPPFGDSPKSIKCINKVLSYDSENSLALLFLAFVQDFAFGNIEKELVWQLQNTKDNCDELNSMLKHAISWYYRDNSNTVLQEKFLRESIAICDKYVWNYVDLADVLFSQNKNNEAEDCKKKALQNVQKVYFMNEVPQGGYDPTDIDEFLNERIKGIYLTKENYRMIEELK